MNRRPCSFRTLAAAVTDSATSMSFRPHFRGGRRGYSNNRPVGPEPLSGGDSHLRDADDRGFRPGYNAPQYAMGQQPHRPGQPVSQQHGPYRHPRRPGFGNYQQQQFRPRPPKPPDYREWEYAKPPGIPPPHSERFTVLSYNILADYLAVDHWDKLYFHIPGYIMNWNWRKKNICFELGLWSADILCFQEVDRFQDIEAELRPRGYNGIWKMRTGDPADGCAIFWRVSRFKLLHEESIEYNKLGLRDNVAQICVFESLNGQNKNNTASTPSTSSSSGSSNRVVICNIHVLFNPKRGEIKLGQIRVLLNRAHAVSKLWDDAPIVICGDFNCTPKSPMYNFITEQKLDLSELPRDKVSGQASAEIRPSRPFYSDFRTRAGDDSTRASDVSHKTEQGDLPIGTQKSDCHPDSANAPSTESYSTPTSSLMDETSESCIGENRSDRPGSLPSHNTADDCANKNTPSNATEVKECAESNLQTLSNAPDNPAIHMVSVENHSDSETSQIDSSKNVEVASSFSSANELSTGSASCESTSAEFMLDEKFEALSLEEFGDGAANELSEDCDSFLSELHSSDQIPFPDDSSSCPSNQKLHTYNNEIENETITDVGSSFSSPSAWTPAEIQIATGSADCNVVEHPLKLTSSYAEVESSSGLRDPNGEPLVTSYHRRFLGTVDYIWHSEGLQAVKVLAPIPKHVMQQSRGFPTKKWGSDHIALVSELAFTKDISSENAVQ